MSSFPESMPYEKINLEFLKELKTNGNLSVIQFCALMKLMDAGFRCPTCNLPMILFVEEETNDYFFWSCVVHPGAECYRNLRSVRSFSRFEGTNLSVIDLLIFIYLWVTKAACEQICDEIPISNIAVNYWIDMFRSICVEILVQESVILGGPGVIVEIYEAKFLYQPITSRITGEWVFLVTERGKNKCFVQVIENRDKSVLLNILHTRLYPGTTIICECWNTYCSFEEKINLGMNNNMLIMDVDPDRRESFWALIEHSIVGYGRKSPYEFDSYVAEFMWRQFHQQDSEALFMSFLNRLSCESCPR